MQDLGSNRGLSKDNPGLPSRLQNGLSVNANREIANDTSIERIVENIVNQLKLLPLVRRSVSRGRNFRILALDGEDCEGRSLPPFWLSGMTCSGVVVVTIWYRILI